MIGSPCIEFSPFAFDGKARHRRGWERSIAIRVQPPFSDRAGEYVCPVNCSLSLARPHFARANEAQHAYSLAFSYLRIMLSDFSLIAPDGTPSELPRIPPWPDDWVPSQRDPGHGLTMVPDAVSPDGELGTFFVAISPPRSDETAYVSEIRYGRREPAVEIVRGTTIAEAYDAAISWLESRLEKDRVTLVDAWNEPIELPRVPRS